MVQIIMRAVDATAESGQFLGLFGVHLLHQDLLLRKPIYEEQKGYIKVMNHNLPVLAQTCTTTASVLAWLAHMSGDGKHLVHLAGNWATTFGNFTTEAVEEFITDPKAIMYSGLALGIVAAIGKTPKLYKQFQEWKNGDKKCEEMYSDQPVEEKPGKFSSVMQSIRNFLCRESVKQHDEHSKV